MFYEGCETFCALRKDFHECFFSIHVELIRVSIKYKAFRCLRDAVCSLGYFSQLIFCIWIMIAVRHICGIRTVGRFQKVIFFLTNMFLQSSPRALGWHSRLAQDHLTFVEFRID